jgi:hypothetical protein
VGAGLAPAPYSDINCYLGGRKATAWHCVPSAWQRRLPGTAYAPGNGGREPGRRRKFPGFPLGFSPGQAEQALGQAQNPAGLPGDLPGDFQGPVHQPVGGHHFAYQAEAQGFGSVDHPAGKGQLQGPGVTDDPGQKKGPAGADGGAVHRCDGRHVQTLQGQGDLLDTLAVIVADLVRVPGEGLHLIMHIHDIAAGGKGGARHGEDHDADALVLLHPLARV